MKKLTKLLTLSLLSFQLVACGGSSKDNNVEDEIETPWNDESSIKLEAMSTSVSLGETYQIKATSSGSLTYTSNNESVATVSSSGLVTTVAEGDAAIKVSNGEDYVYFRIHVGEASGAVVTGETSLYLPNGDLSLYIGEKYTLNPKLLVDGKEIKDATYTYTVSRLAVAMVIDSKINALTGGVVTVTVTGSKDGVSASKEFTLTVYEELTYLVPDFETRQVVSGTPLNLNFVLIENSVPVTAGVSAPTYTVSDENIAYVMDNQLFSIHKGYVTVTAKVIYDSIEYSCDVEIAAKELYKVTYTVEGTKVFEEHVISGDTISYTEVPTKKDSVFKCWGQGDALVYADTPINYAMNLEAKWLVYSTNISSEDKVLLWDYSTGSEVACDNGGGTFLWEDYRFPDTHINVLMTAKKNEITNIILPKFEYALFPAVSFYFVMEMNTSQFVFGNYTSSSIEKYQRCQVSIIGNKLYFDGEYTGETIQEEVTTALDSFKFQIKAPANNGGRMFLSGFYCHLGEE